MPIPGLSVYLLPDVPPHRYRPLSRGGGVQRIGRHEGARPGSLLHPQTRDTGEFLRPSPAHRRSGVQGVGLGDLQVCM